MHRAFGIFIGLMVLCLPAIAGPVGSGSSTEVVMNRDAGSGGYLFLTLRLESGENLLFMVDTGSPITLVDKSLASKLGDRVGSIKLHTLYGNRDSGAYVAPKLYLGDKRLITGTNVFSSSFTPQSIIAHRRIRGILGMDCLRHYWLQLDFETWRVRLMEPGASAPSQPGKTYPLSFVWGGVPVINHTGLAAGSGTNLLVDTGCHIDGFVEKSAIKGNGLGWWYWLFGKKLSKCVWDGQTYSHLVVRRKDGLNLLGLRFLARHLVTLDFPNQTMYLEQQRADPIKKADRDAAAK